MSIRLALFILLLSAVIIFSLEDKNSVTAKENSQQESHQQISSATTSTSCSIAGCSRELCVDSNSEQAKSIGICLWKEEFACYKAAKCEVQKSGINTGKCGWTMDENLISCLQQYSEPGVI